LQKNNSFFYLVLLFLVSLFIFLCIVSYIGVFEDAFISFRYAYNLAAGHGLIFNAGEHVWGYSNFLWTVLLALGLICGFPIAALAKYLGVFSATVIITALFCWFLKQDRRHTWPALAASLLLVTSTHFLIASQNGLETVFFTALMFLGIILFVDTISAEKKFPWYSICFLLASLTRPEGPLLIVVAGFVEIILFLRFRKRVILERLGLAAAVFTVGYGAYILLMHAYYDAWLPNAFFVKVNLHGHYQFRQGINYLLSFLDDIRAAFLLWPLFFLLTDRKRARQNAVIMLFLIAYLLFVVKVGGDFQVYFYRFMIPVLPLLFLLSGRGLLRLYELLQSFSPGFAKPICMAIAVVLIGLNFGAVKSPIIPFYSQTATRTPVVIENLKLFLRRPEALKKKVCQWFSSESLDIQPMDMVGKVLGKKLKAGVSVATGQSGQIPFYLPDCKIVDMIGLMDDEVARRGITLKYFKQKAVDYCIFYYSETANYFIPLTLYPRIVYADYFSRNYRLEHVFRHRSIFPERGLFSEKFMLLFKKREEPLAQKAEVYNLRQLINVCFETGHYTDLKCNLNGLERGQYVSEGGSFPKAETELPKKPGIQESTKVSGRHEDVPVQLDGQRPEVFFRVEKPGGKGLSEMWSHVKLAAWSDYAKVKMQVSVVNSSGRRLIAGCNRVPAQILSAESPLGAWLPVICKISPEVNSPGGDWQVQVVAPAAGKPVLVDEPMWVKNPPWSQSRFVALSEHLERSRIVNGGVK